MDIRHLFRQVERGKFYEDAENGAPAMNSMINRMPHFGIFACLLFVLSLVLLAGIISSAQATIPIILQRTLQLPPGGGWDVQHVMDANSFGWARLSGDTIRYQMWENDSVRSRTIPHCFTEPVALTGHVAVRLMRLAPADGRLCAMVYSTGFRRGYDDEETDYNILSIVDLASGECLHASVSEAGGYRPSPWGYTRSTITITQFYPWPPPPAVSTHFFTAASSASHNSSPEGEYSYVGGFATRIMLDSTWQIIGLGPHSNVQPFSRLIQEHVILSGTSYGVSDDNGYSLYSWCSIGTYDPIDSLTVRRDLGYHIAAAQVDADGTERMILSNSALDPMTFDTLWQNADLSYGTKYTARLPGSPNERILVSSAQAFLIYNASDGSYIGRTSVYNGTLQGLIKHADRATEIVTFDSNTSLVRIYTTAPPSVRHLTIRYIPETQHIRLHWEQAAGAIGHKVYSTDRPSGGDLNLIAELPADSLSYDVQPIAEKRFFFVTDEFEAR
jgi:hypothetical protein